MEQFLYILPALACPVGMGLMMWFMSRGMGDRKRDAQPGSIDDLRAEQARLAAQIDQLEHTETPMASEQIGRAHV